MGAQAFMLAGTFNLVIAQRLGRRVCSHCVTKISVKDDKKYLYAKKTFQNFDKQILKKEIVARGITQQQRSDFFTHGYISQGTGKDPRTGEVCPLCKGIGYKGRVGIYEMMDYTDDIRMMLLDGKSAFEIGKYALSQ